MKNAVSWNVTPYGSYKNCSVRRLVVTANVPSSSILVTLMEALSSSETSVRQNNMVPV
jgi:hypothetical protein